MPGFENKITEYSYNEPYSTRCKQKLPFGGWTWVPCIKQRKRITGVFVGFNYPHITPEQQIALYNCANAAINAAGPIVLAATFATLGVALTTANGILRETYKKCVENSGLPPQVINQTNIGIYKKRLE